MRVRVVVMREEAPDCGGFSRMVLWCSPLGFVCLCGFALVIAGLVYHHH